MSYWFVMFFWDNVDAYWQVRWYIYYRLIYCDSLVMNHQHNPQNELDSKPTLSNQEKLNFIKNATGWGRIAMIIFNLMQKDTSAIEIYPLLKKLHVPEWSLLWELTYFLYPDGSCELKDFDTYYQCVFEFMYNEWVEQYQAIQDKDLAYVYMQLAYHISLYLEHYHGTQVNPHTQFLNGKLYLGIQNKEVFFGPWSKGKNLLEHCFAEDGVCWVDLFFVINHFQMEQERQG